MRIENDANNYPSQRLYFLATGGYLGNKRGAYGQNLNFALNTRVPPTITAKDGFLIIATDGDVILQGTSTPYVLVYQFPQLPAETRTNYVVRLEQFLISFGVTGAFLCWLESFLAERTHSPWVN